MKGKKDLPVSLQRGFSTLFQGETVGLNHWIPIQCCLSGLELSAVEARKDRYGSRLKVVSISKLLHSAMRYTSIAVSVAVLLSHKHRLVRFCIDDHAVAITVNRFLEGHSLQPRIAFQLERLIYAIRPIRLAVLQYF